jgi:hypothetical protein
MAKLPAMTALSAVLYLAAVIWAIMESAKRWMTFIWILGSLAGVVAVLWLISFGWPSGTAILGHAAGILSFAISGYAGITHMRAHRRVAAEPKP